MRVLFVDREPRVLEALERVLFGVESGWQARFVQSAEQALQELQLHTYDALVTETSLPTLSGAALLMRVRALQPRVARIVLSSEPDEASRLGLINLAHQFLAKPCAADTLFQVVSRIRDLNQLLGDRRLQSAVGQIGALSSSPPLFEELSALLAADTASADGVAAIVKQDPAMSSKLLQAANSSFFGRPASIADVETAIMRLGLAGVRTLVLGVKAFQAARDNVDESALSIQELQLRSLEIAKLASRMVPLPEDSAAAYMAGLLCDVGQLVLAQATPERLYVTEAEAARAAVPDYVAERATWGVTHAEIGAFLLGLWGLPFRIVEAVANHHVPERHAEDRLGLSQVVWLATCLVDGERPSPELLRRFGAEALYQEHRRELEKSGV